MQSPSLLCDELNRNSTQIHDFSQKNERTLRYYVTFARWGNTACIHDCEYYWMRADIFC
jgi:hypothetical protein